MTTYFHAGVLCFCGTKKETNLLQRCSMEKFPRVETKERFVVYMYRQDTHVIRVLFNSPGTNHVLVEIYWPTFTNAVL